MTRVINLFGAPGVGKTTAAAEIFVEMKRRGILCELVTEFAKKAVWEKRSMAMQNEILLFAQKHHDIFVLDGQVDFIIVDSPLLLTTIYNSIDGKVDNLNQLAVSEFERFDNINIFLKNEGNKEEREGRIHHGVVLGEINASLDILFDTYSSFPEPLEVKELDVERLVDKILWGDYDESN